MNTPQCCEKCLGKQWLDSTKGREDWFFCSDTACPCHNTPKATTSLPTWRQELCENWPLAQSSQITAGDWERLIVFIEQKIADARREGMEEALDIVNERIDVVEKMLSSAIAEPADYMAKVRFGAKRNELKDVRFFLQARINKGDTL